MDGRKGPGLVTRRTLIRATLLGAGALLAACAGAAPTAVPAAKPTEAPAAQSAAAKPPAEPTKPVDAVKPSTSAEKVSVRVFNRGHPVNEVIKGGADEYVAAHPNVTV